jgi:hypothetical protein
MAKEAGGRAQQNKNCDVEYVMSADSLKAFEALVRADERTRTWTQAHWTEYERSIAAVEREACAKLCESKPWSSSIDWWRQATKREVSERSALECANSIRARGNA